MIIARSPFRITLGGGGTDMPEFYKKNGSFFISAAIDKYIYVCLKRNLLEDYIRCQYLATEIVNKVDDLRHDRARECLKHFNINSGVEIVSIADLPSGSGLGSSGSYIVALLNALARQEGSHSLYTKKKIAELAFKLEHDVLGEPVGKQDQYIAAVGGITAFSIDSTGLVTYKPVNLKDHQTFYKRCRIYFTNTVRDASKILAIQHSNPPSVEDCMKEIQEIGYRSYDALSIGNFDQFGRLLHKHWQTKKKISSKMSVNDMEILYNKLHKDKKVLGGKIIGAGGGGFMMLYVPKNFDLVDKIMLEHNFKRIPYEFDMQGCKIIEAK